MMNLTLCIDCTLAVVNDDYSGLTPERAEEVAAAVRALPPFPATVDGGEHDFSSTPCGCCGSTLAGQRQDFVTD